MRTKRILSVVAAWAVGVSVWAASPRYDIVPLPKRLVEAPGEFVLNKATALVVEDDAFAEVAEDFRAQVALATGFPLSGKGAAVVLRKVPGLGLESYRLPGRCRAWAWNPTGCRSIPTASSWKLPK